MKRMRWAVVACMLMFLMSGTAKGAEPPNGSLVIIGGGLKPDNAQVWQRMVTLAGGKDARIAVFASASANPERSAASTIASFERYGAKAFFVPIAIKLKTPDYRQAASDPALVEQVRGATGVYFTGGDQGRITQALVLPDGSPTPVLQAIWQVYRKGGMIGGSSAGAAIMSSTMFFEPPDDVLTVVKTGVRHGHEITRGLGFIGKDVFVDQHFLVRGRFARMLPVLLDKGYQIGLGVDENTALVVTKDRQAEVAGASGVLLMDVSAATRDASKADFNVSNVRVSYLDRGDAINLQTRVVTPSEAKRKDLKVDPNAPDFKPEFKAPRFYADVLGRMTLVELLSNFIDNPQREVIGLAFGGAEGVKPELGFEYRFRKGPDSLGWFTTSMGGEDYTVLNIYLDVTPIQVPQPLYKYR
jgi:cyanophycinase